LTPALTQECLAYGAERGVKLNPAEAKKSRDWIANQIRAQIGHAAFGDDGLWPVFHQSDNQVTTALSCVRAAREMEQTGALNLATVQKPQPKNPAK
jgi:carboxyl-terminal processing protease